MRNPIDAMRQTHQAFKAERSDWQKRVQLNSRGELAEATMGHRFTTFDISLDSLFGTGPSLFQSVLASETMHNARRNGVHPRVAAERGILYATEPNWQTAAALYFVNLFAPKR